MKKILFVFLLVSFAAYPQKEREYILEDDVARILRTLSADEMMGRPAMNPIRLEPATAFIESEFSKIGLKPLEGLNSFRQEFFKTRVQPLKKEVVINGKRIHDENSFLVSDKAEIVISKLLPVRRITYDASASNPGQHFFGQAFELMGDSLSALIFVAPEFQKNFLELKAYFNNRFVNDRQYVKIFVLGEGSVTSFSATATQKLDPVKMTNVVGMLEGTSRSDEFVVFSAHYDHIGVLPPVNLDSIANGADDDASGTTAVIALARYFQKLNDNERPIIFVAFTAEELGGYGSRYFSEQIDARKVVAMLNIEMIGKPSLWGQDFAFITGFDMSDLGAILERNMAGKKFAFRPDPYPDQDLFYRSDNATLARLGVPAHTISTDQIDIDPYYHTVDDEFETTDIQNITNTIRAIAAGAKSIVEGVDTPTRIDPSTVR